MELYSEWVLALLLASSLVILTSIVRKIGKGAINVVFGAFMVGVGLLAMSRLFLDLADWGFYTLTETTLHLWWHSIFYLSMVAFIWGGRRIKEIARAEIPQGYGRRDTLFLGSLVGLGVVIFGLAPRLEPMIGQTLEATAINRMGLHHFVAMSLGMIAAYYMYYIKNNWGRVLGVGAKPLIWFLFAMGLQHLWELLTESWQLIIVAHELIEQVEQAILVLGLLALCLAFVRIRRVVYA